MFHKPFAPGPYHRIPFIILLFLDCAAPVVAQQYPVLTHNITFDELVRRTVRREVHWINPNGVQEQMVISEMAIPETQSMRALTRDFVRATYGMDSLWLTPKIIVFHAMGDGDLRNSLEVSSFLNDEIPASWGLLANAGKLPNGAHFIIEKNGNIICLSPPMSLNGDNVSYERDNHRWFVKRHQDGNPFALGIENATDQNNYVDLTMQQIEANAKLARWLIWMEQGKINYLASHHQFNSDVAYDSFLVAFGLKNFQKKFRTTGRKDIGDRNLSQIAERIRRDGYQAKSFFDLK